MNPSVLILSRELTFLLHCYSLLHEDPRIGRVETVTSRDEAVRLLETFRPDVAVLDSSAGDSTGLAALVEQCKLPSFTKIVVTCNPKDGATVGPEARSIGAVGLVSRESFSARTVLKADRLRPGTRPARPAVTPA